jgi:tetratricopeptide (TPR) repeat protein
MKNIIISLLTVVIMVPLCDAEHPENELPMYGGRHIPETEENKEFSVAAAKLGWKYYQRGDLDVAIKRFNQAWMFDRNSIDAFWGFGVVLGRRASQENEDVEYNLKESIRFLEIAREKAPQNARILVDLGVTHIGLGKYLKENKKKGDMEEFAKAEQLLEKAEKLEPENPDLYANRSFLYFHRGDYSKARELMQRAKALGFKSEPAYEEDLKKQGEDHR